MNVKVEINVYDSETGILIETVYEKLTNVANRYILFNSFPNSNTGQIIIDTESYLRSRKYVSGNFGVSYKFYIDILGKVNNFDKQQADKKIKQKEKQKIKAQAALDLLPLVDTEGTLEKFCK